ncbi:MarR family winged helix-turn-helix transcriptional regulator [Streptomyces sp. FIT100]|uniref:MarR family winged helix-turn-helix transcriptional regulator n=1 Tax=Streptomyces sp. FIT100 TaxID=2837956 RepID=UPI0021CA33DA|nr:MarR family winged helix-turn-helix transcriptional regulator [Streptomyces sp. FIT100]UUN26181.1 MarR family winged helix-turn-helix transcriptional regulator [Streptomyces sp. FIT100]
MNSGADPACTADELLPAAARGGPVSHAVSRVARLHRIAAGKLLRRLGLYPGQEMVMMHLWETGPVRQSDLIKAVALDPSTVTKMLQRLEQSGHVRRRPDPADRRAVLVEATDASCALHADVARAWSELEDHTLAGLDPAERAELIRLLAKVEANLCVEAAECQGQDPAGAAPAAEPAAARPGSTSAQPESTSSALSTSASEL